MLANKFKSYYSAELSNAKYVPLKTTCPNIFAYARVCNNSSIIVFGNLDFANSKDVVVKVPKFSTSNKVVNLRVHQNIKNDYSKGKIKTNLGAGEIQVLLIRNLVF